MRLACLVISFLLSIFCIIPSVLSVHADVVNYYWPNNLTYRFNNSEQGIVNPNAGRLIASMIPDKVTICIDNNLNVQAFYSYLTLSQNSIGKSMSEMSNVKADYFFIEQSFNQLSGFTSDLRRDILFSFTTAFKNGNLNYENDAIIGSDYAVGIVPYHQISYYYWTNKPYDLVYVEDCTKLQHYSTNIDWSIGKYFNSVGYDVYGCGTNRTSINGYETYVNGFVKKIIRDCKVPYVFGINNQQGDQTTGFDASGNQHPIDAFNQEHISRAVPYESDINIDYENTNYQWTIPVAVNSQGDSIKNTEITYKDWNETNNDFSIQNSTQNYYINNMFSYGGDSGQNGTMQQQQKIETGAAQATINVQPNSVVINNTNNLTQEQWNELNQIINGDKDEETHNSIQGAVSDMSSLNELAPSLVKLINAYVLPFFPWYSKAIFGLILSIMAVAILFRIIHLFI